MNLEIVYLPHRLESQEKLNLMKLILEMIITNQNGLTFLFSLKKEKEMAEVFQF